ASDARSRGAARGWARWRRGAGPLRRTLGPAPQVRIARVVGADMPVRRSLVLALLALAALAPSAAADSYVALGDSYVAGPAIPLPIKPWGCIKSDHNYAHLAAPRLGPPTRRSSRSASAATTSASRASPRTASASRRRARRARTSTR